MSVAKVRSISENIAATSSNPPEPESTLNSGSSGRSILFSALMSKDSASMRVFVPWVVLTVVPTVVVICAPDAPRIEALKLDTRAAVPISAAARRVTSEAMTRVALLSAVVTAVRVLVPSAPAPETNPPEPELAI